MALPDLTGQNIENTYQRIVQTDGTNFYDGTGSLVILPSANTASLLTTASAVGNTITFTKGNASQFSITVDTGSGGTIDTSSLVTTSSFNAFTSSINQFTSSYNTGSFTGSFTGSLLGTASYATTASYALNGGVTQLLAGSNISLSPTTGVGQVTISSTGGGGGFNTATGSYGSFYSTVTQTNVANTARSMSLNVTDISNGISISGSTNPYNTYIKTENPGIYDIQFSAQVDKTDSGTDEIWIWLRKNGVNVDDSATSIQLVGNGAHYVAAWNFFVNAAANDYYQLMWYSPDANVRLHAEAGFGVVPGIPSLIVTVNRVDQFLSNTGSFSGSFIGEHTGSFTGSFTGSLLGTGSWANNAVTASYVLNAVSSSFASTSSYISPNNALLSGLSYTVYSNTSALTVPSDTNPNTIATITIPSASIKVGSMIKVYSLSSIGTISVASLQSLTTQSAFIDTAGFFYDSGLRQSTLYSNVFIKVSSTTTLKSYPTIRTATQAGSLTFPITKTIPDITTNNITLYLNVQKGGAAYAFSQEILNVEVIY